EGISSKRTPGLGQWGLDFYTGFQPRMTINNSGNVGIGTVNPASKLEVAGTVTAQGFGGNWQLVTGDVTAEPNRAYLVNSADQINLTLPASATVGDLVRVSAAGAG